MGGGWWLQRPDAAPPDHRARPLHRKHPTAATAKPRRARSTASTPPRRPQNRGARSTANTNPPTTTNHAPTNNHQPTTHHPPPTTARAPHNPPATASTPPRRPPASSKRFRCLRTDQNGRESADDSFPNHPIKTCAGRPWPGWPNQHARSLSDYENLRQNHCTFFTNQQIAPRISHAVPANRKVGMT